MSLGLAAQWRFHCRVLRRLAPEERVQDVKRQVKLGDHVFVSYTWEQTEQHGIICSVGGKDSQGRRGGRNTKEDDGAWVVFWDAAASRLQCVALPQFAKGGDLVRVEYPHWVCQCHLPAVSTMNPQVVEERELESESGDEVAKRANGLFQAPKSKAWEARWTQAPDLEFCIEAKTGSRLTWEIHGRKAIQTASVPALGFAISGERPPSKVFGAMPNVSPAAASQPAPPGYTPQGWQQGQGQQVQQGQQVVLTASHFDTSQQNGQNQMNPQAQQAMAQQMWAGQAAWNPYSPGVAGWGQGGWAPGQEMYMPQQMDFNQMAQMTQQMTQMTQMNQMNQMGQMTQMQPVAMPTGMPTVFQ